MLARPRLSKHEKRSQRPAPVATRGCYEEGEFVRACTLLNSALSLGSVMAVTREISKRLPLYMPAFTNVYKFALVTRDKMRYAICGTVVWLRRRVVG